MPALVLAAGRSTRIAPVAAGRPKPLLDMAGRSLLEWNLLWLAAHRVDRVWINLHHEGDAIRAAIGSGDWLGVDVRYSPEAVLLGTAGAWRRLRGEWPSTSLVVYGDNLMRFDLDRLLRAHREQGTRMTVAVFDPAKHAHTAPGGGAARVEEDGRVTAFYEGVPSAELRAPSRSIQNPEPRAAQPTEVGGGAGWRRVGSPPETEGGGADRGRRTGWVGRSGDPNRNPQLINAGVYAVEPDVAALIGHGYQDFGRDVLPGLAERGWLGAHVIEPTGFCLGVDTPERYARAKAMVAGGVVAL